MRTYRVIELFSGVGAQRMALERLKARYPGVVDFEYVAQCDIDKHALRSYDAIHGETPNLGNIAEVERLPPCDVVTWSFPCTDLSMAGQQKGMEEGSGTRSALCWEVIRVLRATEGRPEWLLMENVPAILFKKNLPEFNRLKEALSELGYDSREKVLNATEFDVAQNRKRCFMISRLRERGPVPEFPEPVGLRHVLRDYLEDEGDVPESCFLSPERLKGLIASTQKERDRGNGFGFEPKTEDDPVAKTVNTREDHRKYTNYLAVERPDSPRMEYELTGGCFRCRRGVYSRDGASPPVLSHDRTHIPKICKERD